MEKALQHGKFISTATQQSRKIWKYHCCNNKTENYRHRKIMKMSIEHSEYQNIILCLPLCVYTKIDERKGGKDNST